MLSGIYKIPETVFSRLPVLVENAILQADG